MSLKNYKVLSEDGAVINDVDFEKDEIVELDSESIEVQDFIDEGVLELDTDSDTLTPTSAENSTPAPTEQSLFYGNKKVIGNVVDVEGGYKSFTTENGETFKLTDEDYAANVILK